MLVLIVGYGKSGKSAEKVLKELGYETTIIEDDRLIDETKIDKLLCGLSFIVVSPGVSCDSKIIKCAKNMNIKVIGELELGYQLLHGKVIAITGTNGKTTTTMLTAKLLEEKNVFVGGNIGTPVSSFATKTKENSVSVLEVSSFQLDSIENFRPNIAAILNITPDHLNYHKTMQNYLNAKLNIFKNQVQSDFAVLNYDDAILKDLKLTKSKTYFFSTKKEVNGCFIKNGCIYFKDTTKIIPGYYRAKKIAKISGIKLLGEHNLSNCLCAITCAIISGESAQIIEQKLYEFEGSTNRLEFVTDIGGVSFYNDSKATNPSSTICAIQSMKSPTTIILGGSDKGLIFDEIFKMNSPLIKNYVFVGQTKNILQKTAEKYNIKNYYIAESFYQSVHLAYALSNKNECVLLSPACASFDMFSGYEERGKCFCGIVREIKKNENAKHTSKT